ADSRQPVRQLSFSYARRRFGTWKMSAGSGWGGRALATTGRASRCTDGAVMSGAGRGGAGCAEDGQLRQAGGQRPSGPSSWHRSGQIVLGTSATDTMTCACITANRKRRTRVIREDHDTRWPRCESNARRCCGLEGEPPRSPGGDPTADQVDRIGGERRADERHSRALARPELPKKLREQEAPVGIAGKDADPAGGLRGRVGGGHGDQIEIAAVGA